MTYAISDRFKKNHLNVIDFKFIFIFYNIVLVCSVMVVGSSGSVVSFTLFAFFFRRFFMRLVDLLVGSVFIVYSSVTMVIVVVVGGIASVIAAVIAFGAFVLQ